MRRPRTLSPWALGLVVAWTMAGADDSALQYGRFQVTGPASELMDAVTAEALSGIVDADQEISWQMYVPETYDPQKPAGLMVFVSPTPRGGMPIGWKPVFDESNLILISADSSGNRTRTKKRMFFAVLAPYAASQRYNIDPTRIYVSGFSGGGKVASITAIQFANLFTGAIYVCGVESIPKVSPEQLELAKSHRYVFMTGSDDFNRVPTRNMYARYERKGLTNISLVTVPRMAHSIPGEEHFREAMRFLDER
ncbi:MAG: hypothetical protein K0U72_14665 [Gammaproteobacteria bacterium]|nr:hypothetical protein [Gammaproteobacteria bacterium]